MFLMMIALVLWMSFREISYDFVVSLEELNYSSNFKFRGLSIVLIDVGLINRKKDR